MDKTASLNKVTRINLLKNIPEEMKKLNNWVAWKLEPDINNPKKPKKMPYNGKNSRASANSPDTWLTYEQAADLFLKYDFDGVGMEIDVNDEYFYIDIDGQIPKDILNSFNSYTEISQSGSGAHIIAKCDKQLLIHTLGKEGRKKDQYEIYAGGRFLAITGNMISETNEISYCTDKAIDFYNTYIKKIVKNSNKNTLSIMSIKTSPTLTDEEVLNIAKNAKNSDKFNDLWEGNLGNKNEEDCALIGILAFYTQDRDQLLRLWKQSNLYRKKTDRIDYTDGVIDLVLNGLTETWQPSTPSIAKPRFTKDEYNDGGTYVTEFNPIFKKQFCKKNEKIDKKASTKIITYIPKLCSENVASLLDYYDIKLKYNLLSRTIDIEGYNCPDSEKHLQESRFLTYVYNRVVEWDFSNSNINIINNLIKDIGMRVTYNPVVDYLNSLSPLNSEDNIKALADTLITPSNFDDTFKYNLLKTWLISCIHAAYTESGFKSEGIIVLQGLQGLMKTTWLKNLFKADKLFFKDGLSLDPDNKDIIAILTRYWCVELGEIGSTFKKDLDKIKTFISAEQDEYRAPYDLKAIKHPRRTIMCATVNEEFFLKDETGNRRYWVIPLIDIKDFNHINIDDVWAEILYIYKNTNPQEDQIQNGTKEPEGKWWLSPREQNLLAGYQEAHEVQAEWETFLESKLRIGDPVTHEYTALEIYKKVVENSNKKISAGQIGKFLGRKKIQKRIGRSNKAYYKLPEIKTDYDYFNDINKDNINNINKDNINNINNINDTKENKSIPNILKNNREINNINTSHINNTNEVDLITMLANKLRNEEHLDESELQQIKTCKNILIYKDEGLAEKIKKIGL